MKTQIAALRVATRRVNRLAAIEQLMRDARGVRLRVLVQLWLREVRR